VYVPLLQTGNFDDLLQVKSVNGVPVKNLEGLVAAVEACKEHFLRFQLEYSQVSIVQEWSSNALLMRTLHALS